MFHSNNLNTNFSQARYVPISKLSTGVKIINLGPLLEVEECADCYKLIINRMDQKQVIVFKKDELLLVEE
jgi:hypothetical protein